MRFLKIYLASSWRNKHFENLLNALRIQGYYTYDFKHPEDNELSGFSWEKVDKDFEKWTCRDFKEGLHHPEAVKAFEKDFHAMQEADYCVLDMSEKPTPELMYQMFDAYVTRPIDLVEHIEAAFHKDNMLLKENFSTHGQSDKETD